MSGAKDARHQYGAKHEDSRGALWGKEKFIEGDMPIHTSGELSFKNEVRSGDKQKYSCE